MTAGGSEAGGDSGSGSGSGVGSGGGVGSGSGGGGGGGGGVGGGGSGSGVGSGSGSGRGRGVGSGTTDRYGRPTGPQRRRPLFAYGVGAFVAWAVASTAFVAYRNHEFAAREVSRAQRAAMAVATGEAPLADVLAAGIVEPAKASKKYPFLKRRRLADAPGQPGSGRALGGVDAPATDKMLADAAAAMERDGAFARFLPDGSGLLLAAVAVPATESTGGGGIDRAGGDRAGGDRAGDRAGGDRAGDRAGGDRAGRASGVSSPAPRGVAVVIARPLAGPAPYPAFVVFGLLGLGLLFTWVGARLGARAQSVGLFVGIAALAPPAAVWGGILAAGPIVALAAVITWLEARGKTDAAAAAVSKHRVAYAYLAPAALGMGLLVMAPFFVGLLLGFFDHSRGEWHYVGLSNFVEILSGNGRSFSDPLNFWFTLVVTMAWTTVNVALHVSIGVVLALALRERWMRARGIFRVLLILPWAVPNYITALIWRGMFQTQFGAVNGILESVGLGKVAWFSEFSTSFTANVVTNTWLGFPFMMVVALGALESIPRDQYEAAAVDGATPWARFRHITLPHLRPALMPAVVLGSIWTFNMFNVIYLVSGGRPAGTTDILVTQAYRWAFERGQRYGMAAAYATIIFIILVIWTLIAGRLARRGQEGVTT